CLNHLYDKFTCNNFIKYLYIHRQIQMILTIAGSLSVFSQQTSLKKKIKVSIISIFLISSMTNNIYHFCMKLIVYITNTLSSLINPNVKLMY
ncbi:uncharacterized protein BX663DRAFT_443470, partial [Cokeromyces recurvatus]|uniref:uncharacterized protein n=1 Tax=Cokeromyces recurvatus TaxID=90255 RepID=UPI00221EDD32